MLGVRDCVVLRGHSLEIAVLGKHAFRLVENALSFSL